jgi:hypothetical protein
MLIILFSLIPLFIKLPYRINIFLSWEGAFRMSNGQLPFRDFGTPIGGVYWIVPAIFFKIFGAQMISLIKAQVFLNILSGLAFRSIMKSIGVDPLAKFIAIIVFLLSYSFMNFWPWYNHTVIVYELIALALLLKHIYNSNLNFSYWTIIMSSFFTICSFLTKQDAGGLTIIFCLVLLLYSAITENRWLSLIIFFGGLVIFTLTFIFLTNPVGFSYWFNHGQIPHSSRVHASDFLEEFFGGSQWIKFYFLLVIILSFQNIQEWKKYFYNKTTMIPLILIFGILVEAFIFAVTSYVPPDNNIFFHSFAISFILNKLFFNIATEKRQKQFFFITMIFVGLWWSGNFWKYTNAILKRISGNVKPDTGDGENIVDRNTYKISNIDEGIPLNEWRESNLFTLQNITLPIPTIEGIERLKVLDLIKTNKKLRVLNMSELTSLAAEIPFELEKGSDYPLWFHLGVGMFNKQAEMFESRILNNYYDLVLFENIPSLNNFYPFRIRDMLKKHYRQIDSFLAPRKGDTQGTIEIYIKNK